MIIPAVGQSWPTGEVLRPAREADATAVAQWARLPGTTSVQGALDRAAERMRMGEAGCYVLEWKGQLVATITIVPPHLQLAYCPPTHRGHNFGSKSAAVLLEDYFTKTKEPWIGDSGDVSVDGEKLTARLGFEWDGDLEGDVLTREQWKGKRATWAAWF